MPAFGGKQPARRSGVNWRLLAAVASHHSRNHLLKTNVNRRNLLVSAFIAISLAIGAYFLVPTILDGPYPRKTSSLHFFDRNRAGMEALYGQLNDDGFSSVKCYPDSVLAGVEPKGPGQPLSGDFLSAYMALCSGARTGMGWRTEDGFLFYLGGAGDDALDFNIALIRLDRESSTVPDCESIEPTGDFGKCQFKLDTAWRLDYEWVSREYLDSFSENES